VKEGGAALEALLVTRAIMASLSLEAFKTWLDKPLADLTYCQQ